MKNMILTASILTLFCMHTAAIGQEASAFPTPAQQHNWLQKFTGEWATESKATMIPGQPAMECHWKMSSRSLGGFWILNEMTGEMSGAPMTCIQTIGYDENKKKYVGTWIDSMTAFMWKYEGTVDPSNTTLTLNAEGPNFIEAGKLTQFQDVYEFTSADEILMSSRMLGPDGKWITFMSGSAKRIK